MIGSTPEVTGTHRGWLAHLLVWGWLSAGCGSTEVGEDPEGANAEVYAEVFCETLCAKYDACAPDPEPFGQCELESCVDDLLGQQDDPCLELGVELVRCEVERQTCDEFFNLDIPWGPDSACYDLQQPFGRCIEARDAQETQ